MFLDQTKLVRQGLNGSQQISLGELRRMADRVEGQTISLPNTSTLQCGAGTIEDVRVTIAGTLLALAPAGGLPGLTGISQPQAGAATCEIWQIIPSSPPAMAPIINDMGGNFQTTVYNLSTAAISAGNYFPVTLDREGQWIAIQSTATPTVVTIPPNGNITINNNGTLVVNIDGGTNTINEYYVYNGTPFPVSGGNDWTSNYDQYNQFPSLVPIYNGVSVTTATAGRFHPAALHANSRAPVVDDEYLSHGQAGWLPSAINAVPFICPHGGYLDTLSCQVNGGVLSPNNPGCATWAAINDPGAGYAVGDVLTLTGGDFTSSSTPAKIIVTAVEGAGEITAVTLFLLTAGGGGSGAGYAVNDVLTLATGLVTQGTGVGSYAAQFKILSVDSGGGILTYEQVGGTGTYVTWPTVAVGVSGGHGTGAQFTYEGGAYNAYPLVLQGDIATINCPASGGSGNGDATFNMIWVSNLVFRIYACQVISGVFTRYPGNVLYESPLYFLNPAISYNPRVVIDTQPSDNRFYFQPNAMYWLAVQSQQGAAIQAWDAAAGIEIDVIGTNIIPDPGYGGGLALTPIGSGWIYSNLGQGIAVVDSGATWPWGPPGIVTPSTAPFAPECPVLNGQGEGDYMPAIHVQFYYGS